MNYCTQCNSEGELWVRKYGKSEKYYSIKCSKCGRCTDWYTYKKDAVLAWNYKNKGSVESEVIGR